MNGTTPAFATHDEALLGVTQSLTVRQWVPRPYDARQAVSIAQKHNLPEILGNILAARGVTPENAAEYLAPTLRDLLPDPSHLRGMDAACARIVQAIAQKETIAIFGDYDVDGATSSALLTRYFRAVGLKPVIYIPDRMKEGYRTNTPALLAIKQRGVSLVITVDCGTVSYAPLAAAKEAGLEVIVIDHHAGEVQLPEAVAVINPNRVDETSPLTALAAVGVAFVLLIAVNRLLRERGMFADNKEPDLLQLLDLVALGTICDVVPLVGLNRAFVLQGLKVMAARQNTGLSVLCDQTGLEEKPSVYHAGFVLGPRINAGGRVGKSDLGVRLLTTESEEEAVAIAAELERHNAERKVIESMVIEEAMMLAEHSSAQGMMILAKEGWHVGVIGIVAGRLKDKYDMPVAIVAMENGIGKASVRSVVGVHVGALVTAAKEAGLLIAGGGHAMAAGFTVAEEKLPALREFISLHAGNSMDARPRQRHYTLDGCIGLQGATLELAESIERAGPYGAGNPGVKIAIANVEIKFAKIVGDGHVKVTLGEGGRGDKTVKLDAIAFRAADTMLGQALLNARGKKFHLAGQVQINEWLGRRTPQLVIEDGALA